MPLWDDRGLLHGNEGMFFCGKRFHLPVHLVADQR